MTNEISCSKCGSSNVIFSKKRNLNICEDCGHELTEPFIPLRIFLSYDREQVKLANRLVEDLTQRGHSVWMDGAQIFAGDKWEDAITDGLNWVAAQPDQGRVLLLMTPRALRRPGGFCRKEYRYAYDRRLDMVPVMVLEVEPPLSICDYHYLDMKGCIPLEQNLPRYQKTWPDILRAVESDQAQRELMGAYYEQVRLRRLLDPMPFDADVALHLARFTGREWLMREFEHWLADPDASRVFWISGMPGVGKTAVAVRISDEYREIVAFHLCRHGHTLKGDPGRVVRQLAFHLSTQVPDYGSRLNALSGLPQWLDPKSQNNAETLFDLLLVQPLHKCPSPDRPVVMLIDGLDEATHDDQNKLAQFLALEMDKLPRWVRFVITSRPVPEIRRPFENAHLNPRVIVADSPQNLDDLRAFLSRELALLTPGKSLSDSTLEKIVERSEGIFLYAEWIRRELQQGYLSLDNVDAFPLGLSGVYQQFFRRRFPDRHEYETRYRPVLETLCAVQEPVSQDFLANLHDWKGYDRDEIPERLADLFPVNRGVFRPFHRSVVEWLMERERSEHFAVRVEEGHQRLADLGWKQFQQSVWGMENYHRTHLPRHLIALERWADLQTLLSTPEYLMLQHCTNRFDFYHFWVVLESNTSYRLETSCLPVPEAFCDNSDYLQNLSVTLYFLGRRRAALPVLQLSASLCRKWTWLRSELPSTLINLGNVVSDLGDIQAGLDLYREAEQVAREEKDWIRVAESLLNQRVLITEKSEEKRLLEEAESAYQLAGSEIGLARCYKRRGGYYLNNDELDKAMQQTEKAEGIFRKLGEKSEIASMLLQKGRIYKKIGDLEKALSFFQKSERISCEIGELWQTAQVLRASAEIIEIQGQLTTAIDLFAECESIASNLQDPFLKLNAVHDQIRIRCKQDRVAEAIGLLSHYDDLEMVNSQGQSPLFRAASDGLLPVCIALIDRQAKIESETNNGWRPLMAAAANGHLEVGQVLITRGADIRARKKDGMDALIIAAFNGRTEFVQFLLDQGADVESRHNDGMTPLYLAAQKGHVQTIQCLLEQGAAIEAETNNGWRPLVTAAASGHLEVGQMLITHGANILARNKDGSDALLISAANGRTEFSHLLLDQGADIESRDINGMTPLYRAADKGDAQTVQLLLEQGAAIETEANDGRRPLMVAAQNGHLDVGKLLITRGTDIRARKIDGLDALIIAALNGRTEFAQLLLEHGADIETQDINGVTPLYYAVNYGHVQTVQWLLDQGAAIEAETNDGWHPLMAAAANGHLDVGQLLITQAADIQVRNEKGFDALIITAGNGRTEFAQLLLEHGADIESRDINGWTPLYAAAHQGHHQMVQWLLDHGAAIEAEANDGWRPLMIAAQNAHLEVGQSLIIRGADIQARNKDGLDALIIAANNGRIEFAQLLLEHGADIETRDINGMTPLYYAANKGHAQTVQWLLEHGAAIESESNNGWRPLMNAAANGHLEVGQVLIIRGADIQARKKGELDALIIAANNGRTEFVQLLIEHGADIESRDINGKTSLYHAANDGHSQTVQWLLEHGAAIEVEANDGWRPLMAATANGHLEVGQVLISRGVDISARKKGGSDALIIAAANGRTVFAQLLLEQGADIETRDINGWTPLYHSANKGHVQTVQWLLEHGADIEAEANDGWRPLMTAAANGHLEVGQVLVSRGADIRARKKDGIDALIIAAANGRTEFAQLLLEQGTDIESRDNDSWTPLYYAANKGHVQTVQWLLGQGAAIEAETNDGWRPLMIAVANGHLDVGKLLFSQGADIRARKKDGSDALIIAAANGQKEFAQLLLESGADIETKDINGWTPLYHAANGGHSNVLELLLDRAAQIETADNGGWRPLMCAASKGHLEIARLLIAHGAQVNGKKSDGHNALTISASNGHTDIVAFLLLSADRQAMTCFGETAATHASSMGHSSVLQLLFKEDMSLMQEESISEWIAAGLDDHSRFERLLVASDRCQRERQFQKAEAFCHQAIGVCGKDQPDCWSRGHAANERLWVMAYEQKKHAEALEFGKNVVELLRRLLPIVPVVQPTLALRLANLSFYYLINGCQQDALLSAEEAKQLDISNNLTIWLNSSYVSLFAGRFEEAASLHRRYANSDLGNGRIWKTEALNDLNMLREAGIVHPDMEKIEQFLKAQT